MDVTRTPLMRFVTLGGAHVAVTKGTVGGHAWECWGCDEGQDCRLTLPDARSAANRHAGQCRAVPKDAPSRA